MTAAAAMTAALTPAASQVITLRGDASGSLGWRGPNHSSFVDAVGSAAGTAAAVAVGSGGAVGSGWAVGGGAVGGSSGGPAGNGSWSMEPMIGPLPQTTLWIA
jgi:hypothetical protein